MEAVIFYQMSDVKTNSSINQTLANDVGIMVAYGIDFLLIAIGFVFNKFGIVLLIRAKTCGISNQNMLLVHLSFVSILCLCLNSAVVFWKSNRIRFPHWAIILFYVLNIAYTFNLVVMVIDRLLFVLLRMRYCRIVTKSVLIVMLMIMWAVSIPSGVTFNMFANLSLKERKNASYIYNGVFILIAASVYVTIEMNIYKSQRRKCSKAEKNVLQYTAKSSKGKIQRRKYMVTFVIVLTFFLVAMVPSFIVDVTFFGKESPILQVLVVVFVGMNVSNYVIVPAIYVFMQPKVREVLQYALTRIYEFAYKTLRCDADSHEKERLIVKSIYDGTNPLYGSMD